MEVIFSRGPLRRIAVIGNHTPCQCGIATFTADLIEAITRRYGALDCFAVAMNDTPEGYDYPPVVRHAIQKDQPEAYQKAAEFLNQSDVDMVCLQHEYGIFGGDAGSFLLPLLRSLTMPIVTTLHTVLQNPSPSQRAVMDELTRLSDRLVVMSERGAQFLREVHDVPASKIDVIHHGIPLAPTTDPDDEKQALDLGGKSVLLTFGLLSPDKGIENVIRAMPQVLQKFPDAVYVVLGATHPQIRKHHGEVYRESLEALAETLGVSSGVRFVNRFVALGELTRFLHAADLYLTPYLKPDQITSGTLAYAVGSGKAVLSTPYHYAQELLAEGRGILVPYRDPDAIAREVIGLLSDPEKRAALEARAAHFGRAMAWPAVAESYLASLTRARQTKTEKRHRFATAGVPRSAVPRSVSPRASASLSPPCSTGEGGTLKRPALDLSHLLRLTDDTGMFQHATFTIPLRAEGYCIDDNARALLLTTCLESSGAAELPLLGTLSTRYLSFVQDAWNPARGRFRNFLSFERRWLEEQGSEDSHGRTLWALGHVAARSPDAGRRFLARRLFDDALGATLSFTSPRAWAYTLLGVGALPGRWGAVAVALAERLFQPFPIAGSSEWPWLEDRLTYANARLPQALLVAGHALGRGDMIETGLASLSWLATLQTAPEGYFSPIGSDGFLTRGGEMARFDQQPIEACAMASACRLAREITGDERWLRESERCLSWFLGKNVLGKSVYDPLSGGCRDGIHPERLNENQGAESTLSFLQTLHEAQPRPATEHRLVASSQTLATAR